MRLLIAVARPFGAPIDYDNVTGLVAELGKIKRHFEVGVLMAATPKSIEREIRHVGYDALHLLCHGSSSGILCMEDGEGALYKSNGTDLLAAIGATSCKLVTLAVCHGAATFDGALPDGLTVIAVHPALSVYQRSALHFYEALYGFLLEGLPAETALKQADARARLDTLVGRELEENLFQLLQAGEPLPAAPEGAPTLPDLPGAELVLDPNLPRPQGMVERTNELYEVTRRLLPKEVGIAGHKPTVVLLHGTGGTGKTTLALMAAKRMREDQRFPGGIFGVGLEGATSGQVVAERIFQTLGYQQPPGEWDDVRAALARAVAARTGEQPALVLLDNIEEAIEGAAGRETYQVLETLAAAGEGVRVLCTSRFPLGSAAGNLVDECLVEGLSPENAREFIIERLGGASSFKADPMQPEEQGLVNLLVEITGGHPLALHFLVAAFKDIRELHGSFAEAAAEFKKELEAGFANLARLDDPALPPRQLGLEEIVDFSLTRLGEQARTLFFRLCAFRDGLAIPPPAFLKDLVGFDLRTFKELKRVGLAHIPETGQRKFVNIQPALRRIGFGKLRQAEPEFMGRLATVYAGWLKEQTEMSAVFDERNTVLDLVGELLVIGQPEMSDALLNNLLIFSSHFPPSVDVIQHLQSLSDNFKITRADAPVSDKSRHSRLIGNLSLSLTRAGRHQEALPLAQEATDTLRMLVEAKHEGSLSEFANCLNILSTIYAAQGSYEESMGPAQEAMDIRRSLAKTQPTIYLPDLAMSLNNLGNQLAKLGRYEEALKSTQEAVKIRRRLAKTEPAVHLPDLAMSLNNLSNRFAVQGQYKKALVPAQQAVIIYRRLVQGQSDVFLPELAKCLGNLGLLFLDLRRYKQALSSMLEVESVFRTLVESQPEVYLSDLAICLNNLGDLLSKLGRSKEALTMLQESVEIYDALAETQPAIFMPNLAWSLHSLGDTLHEIGKKEPACEAYLAAVVTILPFAQKQQEVWGLTAELCLHDLQAHCPEALEALKQRLKVQGINLIIVDTPGADEGGPEN